MASEIDRIDRDFPRSTIKEISKEHDTEITKALSDFFNRYNNLDEYQSVERFSKEIHNMIYHIDNRINYWENRRTQFLQIAAAILAASLIGIVSIYPTIPDNILDNTFLSVKSIVVVPVFVTSLLLFIGSIRIIRLWNIQNNPNYPFTKGTQVWRWHYRHAEKDEVSTTTDKFDENEFDKQARLFASNLAHYKIKTLESSPEELIDQDLSQLFLLITNEKFKIKFVSRLRDALYSTLRNSLGLFIVSFVVMFLAILLV